MPHAHSYASDQAYIIEGRNAFYRPISLSRALSNTHYYEHADYTIAITGAHYPAGNMICLHHHHLPPRSEMEKILACFTSNDVPFLLWDAPIPANADDNEEQMGKSLSNYGLQYGGALTGICACLQDLPNIEPVPDGIAIRPAQNDREIEIFTDLVIAAFEIDPSIKSEFFALFKGKPVNALLTHFIAYKDLKPVGGVTLMESSLHAGLWNFAVLPEYRRQGIGSALIQEACLKAQKGGHSNAMAILTSSETLPLWERKGFRGACRFPSYVKAF
jgi:GNAT superfamily N-acetyltransferase